MATRGSAAYNYSGSTGQTALSAALQGAEYGAILEDSHIIVGVTWHTNDATATVSDAAGNTYIPLTKRKKTDFNEWVQLFYVDGAIAAASPEISVAFNTAVDRPTLIWREARGLAAESAFVEEDWGETVSASMTVSSSALEATGAGFIFAMAVHTSSGSYTAGTDYTLVYAPSGQGGAVDRINSTGGSYTPTFNHASNRNSVVAAVLFQDVAGGGDVEETVTPTTGAATIQGLAPTVNAFTTITLRGTMINEAGSPLASLTDIRCLVWYGSAPVGAPDESLSSLTTNTNGSYSFALALGGLAFNDPVYRVIYLGDPPTRNHAGRRIPDYE